MAIITSESDPALHAVLSTKWNSQGKPGWIINSKTTYRVVGTVSGEVAFSEQANKDLFDSRSVTGSRPATYTKLDK